MKLSELRFLLKHSNLVKELNDQIKQYNNKITNLGPSWLKKHPDNTYIEKGARINSLSEEALKEIVILNKSGILDIKFTIMYGINKDSDIHYGVSLDFKYETDKREDLIDHTHVFLTPKFFTKLLTYMTENKLNFALFSCNNTINPIILEEENDIFEEYEDEIINFDIGEEDEDEEDDSF